MGKELSDLKSFSMGRDRHLYLIKSFAIATMQMNDRSIKKVQKVLGDTIPKGTLIKWNHLGTLRTSEATKTKYRERMNNRKKAIEIKNTINSNIGELERIIENTTNKGEKEALRLIEAQLIKKIDIKQKVLSDEINDQLFRVLKIVSERLENSNIQSGELLNMMSVLKDVSAIVGLTGKTPLIAQQFNNIQNVKDPIEDTKIKAIEVEIIDNEVKD